MERHGLGPHVRGLSNLTTSVLRASIALQDGLDCHAEVAAHEEGPGLGDDALGHARRIALPHESMMFGR